MQEEDIGFMSIVWNIMTQNKSQNFLKMNLAQVEVLRELQERNHLKDGMMQKGYS